MKGYGFGIGIGFGVWIKLCQHSQKYLERAVHIGATLQLNNGSYRAYYKSCTTDQ